MIENIKTSNQAIKYFFKFGNKTPIKFISCIYDQIDKIDFDPYHLKVISVNSLVELDNFFQFTPTSVT